MKRSELPLYKELERTEKEAVKRIARQHGWRQSSYIEWKTESGYFLCLDIGIYGYVLQDICLKIKPLFIDDLWWDVFNLPSNKSAPKSLRGLGAFAIPAPMIAEYKLIDPDHALNYSEDSIKSILQVVFQKIDKDIQAFLSKHPDPELFCPEDGGEYGWISPIYTLTMDLHAGKYNQVEERIQDFRNRRISSVYGSVNSSLESRDAFDYFLDWCHRYSKKNQ